MASFCFLICLCRSFTVLFFSMSTGLAIQNVEMLSRHSYIKSFTSRVYTMFASFAQMSTHSCTKRPTVNLQTHNTWLPQSTPGLHLSKNLLTGHSMLCNDLMFRCHRHVSLTTKEILLFVFQQRLKGTKLSQQCYDVGIEVSCTIP